MSTPRTASCCCRACAWRWMKGHDRTVRPIDLLQRMRGEPAGGLDDRRYRTALPYLRLDDYRASTRLALQGARPHQRKHTDDSSATTHEGGVYSRNDRTRGSFPCGKARRMTYRYQITLRPLNAAQGAARRPRFPTFPAACRTVKRPRRRSIT